MSTRIEKVNSLLEQEISKILVRDFSFTDCLVTLTHVDTSPNLIQTKAYISVMPSASAKGSGETMEDKTDHVIGVLNKGVYSVQQKINRTLNMRPIPKIMFVRDKEIAGASRVEELLEQLKKEEK